MLGGFAAVGCGLGALICGRISGTKVELGLVPLAGIGIAAVLAVLGVSASDYMMLAGLLLVLGVFGGLYFLPCLSWLQQATASTEKGLILSTSNMLSMAGVLSASTGLWLLHDVIGLTPKAIFGVSVIATALFVLTTLVICREIRSRARAVVSSLGQLVSTCHPATTS